MSFFRQHRHNDGSENKRQDPPPAYSQPPPAAYSPPPPSYAPYSQPPPAYSQPPPAFSQPPPPAPYPPPQYSQHPHMHQPPTYPPAYTQPPPACTLAAGPFAGEKNSTPTVRIYTKAGEDYSLSIREGTVVLVPANPRDEHQHWYKDFRWGTKVKDEEGLPAFALVNKATGLAIKHSLGPTHPVRLVPFNPEYLDESILWTESHDTGEGFRCIRMVNNVRLNFDAFHGDKDHGGVHDGTAVVLWEWAKGKNQRWKIVPYY